MEKVLYLNNNVEDVRRIAPFVESLISEWRLPESWDYSLNLVLEEVFVNIVHYAFPEGGRHVVEVLGRSTPESLVLQITDDGLPFDPTQTEAVDVSQPAAERSVGGLGIHLVRQLTDGMAYARVENQNRLILTKKRETVSTRKPED